jgi:hypothetical protein
MAGMGIPGATLSTFAARLDRLKRVLWRWDQDAASAVGKSLLAKDVALFLALIISKMQFTGVGQNCALVRPSKNFGRTI